jgi:hypothetical protein
MKNYLLTFLLAALIVLSGISVRRAVAGIGSSPVPPLPGALAIGSSPVPPLPGAIGSSPVPPLPGATQAR